MRALVLLTLPACLVLAQQPLAQQPPAQTSLQGTVVDASGRPIELVKLALLSEFTPPPRSAGIGDIEGPHTQSDSSGRFRFDSVEPGRYYLIADKSGFGTQAYGGKGDSHEGMFLDLSAASQPLEVIFPMVATGAISGHVVDEHGDPEWGKRVTASHAIHDALGSIVPDASVSDGGSGSEGQFTIPNLPPGMYNLPGIFESIRVDAGAVSSGYTVKLAGEAPVNVRGRVIGSHPPSAGVYMGPRGRCSGHKGIGFKGDIASDGSFEVTGVHPGAYSICVMEPNTRIIMVYSFMDLDVPSQGVDNLVLQLTPRFSVSGKMIIDGQPDRVLAVYLRQRAFGSASRSAQVFSDGAFTLPEVQPVQHDLTVSALPPGVYVASVRLGDREVSGRIDFTHGDPKQPLAITLKRSSSENRGSAPPGSVITLIPEPERADQLDLSLRTTTDTTGVFILRNVAPGGYRITAWEELERNARLDPEFMKVYRDKGAPITVGENARATVSLIPIPRTAPR